MIDHILAWIDEVRGTGYCNRVSIINYDELSEYYNNPAEDSNQQKHREAQQLTLEREYSLLNAEWSKISEQVLEQMARGDFGVADIEERQSQLEQLHVRQSEILDRQWNIQLHLLKLWRIKGQ